MSDDAFMSTPPDGALSAEDNSNEKSPRRMSPVRLLTEFRANPTLQNRTDPTEISISTDSRNARISLVPFYTAGPALEDEIGEGRFNNHFHLRVYLPKTDEPIEHVFIFLNGFAEATTAFWDAIGDSLANAGCACIWLPLPYHFSRNVFFNIGNFDEQDSFKLAAVGRSAYTEYMKDDLVRHPERFLDANRQLNRDLRSLMNHIKNPGVGDQAPLKDFLGRSFQRSPGTTLIGYSLGGLCALQRFLSEPNRFEACILLNSGASFQDMDGSSMFDSDEHKGRWLMLLRGLLADAQSKKDAAAENFYSHVILGHSKVELHDLLVQNRHKVLFLIGGTDPIINFHKMANLEPHETGLAIFQIPGLRHFINVESRDGKEWEPWSKVAVQVILTFVRHHPHESALLALRRDEKDRLAEPD